LKPKVVLPLSQTSTLTTTCVLPKEVIFRMSVRLFVGNLPYDATEAELREFFSPVGTLSYVTFPMDRESGKPRGFAFVDFGDRAQADEAIRKFNGTPFKGRALAINEARARENRPPGGTPPPRYSTPRPLSTGFPRRTPPSEQSMLGSLPDELSPRNARRNRTFGPDAKPKRGRRDERWAKAEGAKKGPIPVRGGGRLYGGLEDEPYDQEDEADVSIFPRENDDEDQTV
jgi:RNA recognition motif-containing protein